MDLVVTYFQWQVMFSRRKNPHVASSATNPIGFASISSNNRTQSQTVENQNLPSPESALSDAHSPPANEKSAAMVKFGGHDAV